MEEITLEELQDMAASVEGVSIARVYNWPEVHKKILGLKRPVTSKEVAIMANTKQPMQARQWLERQCVDFTKDMKKLRQFAATGKYFRYPPTVIDPTTKRAIRPSQQVVYIPVSVFLDHVLNKAKA